MGTTHVQIIERWPSLRAFAEDIGAEYNTAKHIRRRGVIPAPYWTRLIEAAGQREIEGVTYEILAAAVAHDAAAAAGIAPPQHGEAA